MGRDPATGHPAPKLPELRILLLGKTGVGKSATGNSILGGTFFPSSTSITSVTQRCQKKEATVNGKRIQVVDTPGFFDSDSEKAFKRSDLETCLKLLAPGPHAIVFVSKAGQLTEEDVKVIWEVMKLFRNEGRRFLVLLFTHKDNLDNKGITLYEHLDHTHADLKELVASSRRRYVAFNNRAPEEERERQVAELIRIIEDLMRRNTGKSCYTQALYDRDKPWCPLL